MERLADRLRTRDEALSVNFRIIGTAGGQVIPRKEISKLRMVAGNETLFTKIIDGGKVFQWVGIGWIDEGEADPNDYASLPVVADCL